MRDEKDTRAARNKKNARKRIALTLALNHTPRIMRPLNSLQRRCARIRD
jgi:hypothetical protein